jgi:hypothetical protein
MPGKERPAASRLVIQRPPTTEPHLRNAGKNTKPSDGLLLCQNAEGLVYRFLRSQPRVIGPWITQQGATPAGATTTTIARKQKP